MKARRSEGPKSHERLSIEALDTQGAKATETTRSGNCGSYRIGVRARGRWNLFAGSSAAVKSCETASQDERRGAMSNTEEAGTGEDTDADISNKDDRLEAILSRENMQRAWAAVKRNDGAAGVDRLTIAATEAHLKTHWPGIREKLLAGDYQPAAVRVVEIPKESGGSRRLGIPTVQAPADPTSDPAAIERRV